jgi:outer membrane receptor protein involved in Fe transport
VTPPDQGQTKPATVVAASSAESEQVVVLSPFVVEASEDKGYTATSTLAGTRVRTDLKDIASSISVVTEQFLKDTGATNSADLLVYTPSTEVAGIRGNFSGVNGAGGVYQENTVSQTTRVRGLDSADNTRDYFLTDIPWDGFNVGRVDLQRGPNSILFGVGSPAGIVNTSLNDASFKTAYHYEIRADEFGSLRNVVDLNQNLVPGVLSIRVALLDDKELYEQKPAFNNTRREYVALRFDPKLFGENSHTSFRVKYEQGNIDSNDPRSIPPIDTINPWFVSGSNQYGNPGFNKLILNQFNPRQMFDGIAYPGNTGGTLANGLDLVNQGRSFWPDIINYYEGTPYGQQVANGVSAPVYPSGVPIKTITAQPNTGLGLNSLGLTLNNGGSTLGALDGGWLPKAVPELSSYLPNLGGTANFGGKAVPGAVYYSDVLLRDPSVFNFYKMLLDGPNKHESQNWKAYNATFDQSFLNDRLAFQVAVDHQSYTTVDEGWMTGQNYEINVDINATYADGTPNPNAGRPYAGNGASQPGLNTSETRVRDVFRFTPTGEFRPSDFLGDTTLAKIIGKQDFTGLYERDQVTDTNLHFAEFAVNPQYILDNSNNASGISPPPTGQLEQNRSFEWIVYLGPSMLNSASAHNAHLTNIPFIVAPPRQQTVTNFNSRWNKPLDPTTPGYVNPSASFTYLPTGTNPLGNNNVLTPTYSPTGEVVTNGTQSDNPANYVGWQQEEVQWMFASNPQDYPDMVSSANRTKFIDTSRGATWQGYLLDGDLVGTFGWRKDVITNYQSNSPVNAISGFVSQDFPDDPGSRTDVRGESKTWGVVYHLPKVLVSKLPWDSTISFFYDRGSNFKADASRLSLAGTILPNTLGNTKEYGVTITTLHDKLTLKIDKFSTKVANATLAGTQGNNIAGLSTNAYFIPDGSIWGYGWATYLQDALANNGAGSHGATISTYGDFANSDGYAGSATSGTPSQQAAALNYDLNGGPVQNAPAGADAFHSHYAGGLAVVNAWVNSPYPATFFSSYNLSPALVPTIGHASGNLRDSYPAGYNDSGGPQTGGGSAFGNHQTTVTNLSEGTEVELQFQPTKNWNITVNYTKEDATHENIDPTSIGFMSLMTGFMNGPGGQIRLWGNQGLNSGTTNVLGTDWDSSLVAPYAVTANQLGHEAPEVSPWRLNLINTYTFDHGAIKGLFVGGAFREEAGRIIGYHFSSTFVNSISSDPNYAGVISLTQGGLDVNDPYRGKNDWHIDAWVGYSRKLTRSIDWRIQLNCRSVGERDHLVTAGVNPDGTITLARIEEGMGFQLTNSFDF